MVRKVLKVVLFVGGATSVCGVGNAAFGQTTLLFNVFLPPASHIRQQVIEPWLKDIERVTDGRVRIKVPPQNMAPPPEQMNMVKTDVADGGLIFDGFLQKSHPLLQIGFLPGSMRSALADGVAYWRTYEKFFAPKHPIKEVKLLGFVSNPPGQLYNIKKTPIQSLSDMKDKKIWSLPGLTARALGMTGAAVVPGPAVRQYEIISKGVVDQFCCVDYDDMRANKVLQFLGAATDLPGGIFSAKFAVFINNAKWKSISAKDRAAIMKISGEALARRARALDVYNQKIKAQYVARGGIVAKAKPAFAAALKRIWKPLDDNWIAMANKRGVDGKAALAYYLAQEEQVAAGH